MIRNCLHEDINPKKGDCLKCAMFDMLNYSVKHHPGRWCGWHSDDHQLEVTFVTAKKKRIFLNFLHCLLLFLTPLPFPSQQPHGIRAPYPWDLSKRKHTNDKPVRNPSDIRNSSRAG